MEDKILIAWWAHSWDGFNGKDTAPLHPWLDFGHWMHGKVHQALLG